MYDYKNFTIAVDFDDTCVVPGDVYPEIECDVPGAAMELAKLAALGVRIILWTCREGKDLDVAVKWFNEHNIPLFGVNCNPDIYWLTHPTGRKIYADVYVDDKALGIPLMYVMNKPVVNWNAAAELIYRTHFYWQQRYHTFNKSPKTEEINE